VGLDMEGQWVWQQVCSMAVSIVVVVVVMVVVAVLGCGGGVQDHKTSQKTCI